LKRKNRSSENNSSDYPFCSREENKRKNEESLHECRSKRVYTGKQEFSRINGSNKKNPLIEFYRNKYKTSKNGVLPWYIKNYVPIESEKILIPLLIKDKNERGMMKYHKCNRIKKIQDSCSRHGIRLIQASSLRRHHIQMLNPGKNKQKLGLGNDRDIFDAAMLFEKAVESYLISNKVNYISEKEQKKFYFLKAELCLPTPDFLFTSPVILHLEKEFKSSINWIEAKMFYGASTIPSDSKSAVGQILSKAKKYVDLYGPGAIIFAYGCGSDLAENLKERNVIALDASPLNLSQVRKHQKQWCADTNGRILI